MIIQKFDCLRGVTVLFSQTIFSMFKRQREGERNREEEERETGTQVN